MVDALLEGGGPPTPANRDGILHLHIHKTAGTSLRHALIEHHGATNVLIYDPEIGAAIPSNKRLIAPEQDTARNKLKLAVRSSPLAPLIRPLFKFVEKGVEQGRSISPLTLSDVEFDALSGHFNADNVQNWNLEDHPTVTVVRDPLERAWSHFSHWKRTQGRFLTHDTLAYSDDVAFETFALDRRHGQNYQSRWLGGLTMTHIGVSDQLPALFEELGLSVPNAESVYLNSGNHGGTPALDPGFVREFREQNSQDFELYQHTQDAWTR